MPRSWVKSKSVQLRIFIGMGALGGAIGVRGEFGWGLWLFLTVVVVITFENHWVARGQRDEGRPDL